MLKLCSRYNIALSDIEKSYLEELFQEELNIFKTLNKYKGVKKKRSNFESSNDYHNYCYGLTNPFRIDFQDIGKEINNHFESYHFLFIKDKRERVLGYICFEVSDLNFVNVVYKILKIKHFYLSNCLYKRKKVPNIMYTMLNDILPDDSLPYLYIISSVKYIFCSGLNGFYTLENPAVFSTSDLNKLYIKPPYGKILNF